MFRNVDAELKRKGMTRAGLAVELGVTPSTLSLKLNGKSPITLPQAMKIKKILETKIPLEILFETSESA